MPIAYNSSKHDVSIFKRKKIHISQLTNNERNEKIIKINEKNHEPYRKKCKELFDEEEFLKIYENFFLT